MSLYDDLFSPVKDLVNFGVGQYASVLGTQAQYEIATQEQQVKTAQAKADAARAAQQAATTLATSELVKQTIFWALAISVVGLALAFVAKEFK